MRAGEAGRGKAKAGDDVGTSPGWRKPQAARAGQLAFAMSAHACVDALCILTVMHGGEAENLAALCRDVLVYNILAFAMQPLAGLLVDERGQRGAFVSAALVLVMAAAVPSMPRTVALGMAGAGNALFHVAAGAEVLERSPDKMGPLGLFVSTGALGVALGISGGGEPGARWGLLAAAVLLLAWNVRRTKAPVPESVASDFGPLSVPFSVPLLGVSVGLLACIGIRSFMGFMAHPVFAVPAVVFTLCAFAGKCGGGLLMDRFGLRRVALFSVPLACVCLMFGAAHWALWGLGQVLVNMSMPCTLYLLWRCWPQRPAFGFGLAAAALFPGYLLAVLSPAGELGRVGLILVLAFNLAVLLAASRRMQAQNGHRPYTCTTYPVP